MGIQLHEIVNAAPDEVATLVRLRQECGWDAESVPAWIASAQAGDRVNFFVITDSEDVSKPHIIGMISLVLDLPLEKHMADKSMFRSELQSLFISSTFRGKGLGEQTVLHTEKYARERGIQELTLHVWSGNKKLIKTYKKLGYTQFTDLIPSTWPGWDGTTIGMRKFL
ncbi:acyl-CoA N-acyltransferase [Chytriomyces sp. MP71]|nr:acyl-CoA N-acyltransferase [Chytriomyces sp. MP71]